jgi:hypothetical protein
MMGGFALTQAFPRNPPEGVGALPAVNAKQGMKVEAKR